MKLKEISTLELEPDERAYLYDMVLNSDTDGMPSEFRQFREKLLYLLRGK